MVCAIVNDAKPFTQEEISVLREAFTTVTRTLHCLVEAFKAGDTWIEARLAAEPGFDLARTVQVFKSVASRRVRALRPGDGPLWAPGYAAATVGEEMDIPSTIAKLASAHPRKEATP